MLPITLQMEIDLSAAAHKREIAERFKEARERLLPDTFHDALRAVMARQQQQWLAADPNALNWYANALVGDQQWLANTPWSLAAYAGVGGLRSCV